MKPALFKSIGFFIAFVIAAGSSALATVRLSAVFGDNMVLQRETAVSFYGLAHPTEKIFITTSWNNQTDSTTGDGNARWKLDIKTPSAGGPYTITIKGENTIVLNNVMVGEVWVCSGQSNMEWSSNQQLPQMLEELPNSANNNLRLLHVPRSTSAYPQENTEGRWKVCDPGSLAGFSAVGYFFAKELQKKLNVPVGIINASWGGTPAEIWTPGQIISADEELSKAAVAQNQTRWWPVTPGYAYNSMIYPVTQFPIAGTIWYQGENNTAAPLSYSKLLTAMINSWRQAWHKDFPFYYVQIAPYTYGNYNVGNLVREQQAKTLSVPNTGMVVISDLVDDVKNVHPKNKIDVAKRLAAYALAETYRQDVGIYKSPMFNRMEIKGNKANLYFDNAPNGFKLSTGKTATEFFIAGEDKVFLPAEVQLEKDKLVVYNKNIKTPVAVRFSFSNEGMSNIFSKEGLPVAPFRTDDWAVDTGKIK